MSVAWVLRTARLVLTPVNGSDLPDLRAFKADPLVFAVMMGGVRNCAQTAEDLAHDVMNWGRYGFGIGGYGFRTDHQPDRHYGLQQQSRTELV